jgi:hypothetical protein
MSTHPKFVPKKILFTLILCLPAFLLLTSTGLPPAAAAGSSPIQNPAAPYVPAAPAGSPSAHLPYAPSAACSGGPTIDGILLDECVVESFTVGGAAKTITVWYTKNTASATRVEDGVTYTLFHGITTDTQAQEIGDWGREAWQRYYEVFNHHPFDSGCGSNINVRLEDGVGWGGIAYWASSGSCWIGIDSPAVIGGSAQGIVYHEFQHYLQYSFNSGCYHFLKDNYNSGAPDGDAEFVEGYADLAEDTVDAALDIVDYTGYVSAYDPHQSFYKKSYFDVFNKYFAEQLGSAKYLLKTSK